MLGLSSTTLLSNIHFMLVHFVQLLVGLGRILHFYIHILPFIIGDSWMYPYQRTPMGNP